MSEKSRIRNTVVIIFVVLFIATPTHARNYGPPRTGPIDMVVIHSTGGPTCDAATGKPIWVGAGTLTQNMREIEAHPKLGIHYMIDRDGTLRSSIPESQIAYHIFSYSRRSIAIELINEGDGKDPFPEKQIDALVMLLQEIVQRREIRRDGIKRHSDLDQRMMRCDPKQRRKVDPGDAFPFDAVLNRVFTLPSTSLQ
ncbi:MAG: N-acetylmuramoyl-L-alanine amidase [Gammaproteobacteria bacterium]|nr:N-acetylmuramoyl-L-alanine amidase [Gammaproteobacteria bacterium]